MKYVYVCVFGAREFPKDAISFQHAFVEAESDEEAYDKGYHTDAADIPEGYVSRLNDYVIAIG